MQTEDLIRVLAADARPVPSGAPQRRFGLASLVGGAAALIATLVWLGLRADLAIAVTGGFFWIKAAYTAAICVIFASAALRLSTPERQATAAWILAGGIIVLMSAAGLWQYGSLPSGERMAAVKGVSWTGCARNIVALAAPILILCTVVLRNLAPTRPALAGLACGLFSGGLAATIYGLHCPEATLVFISLWYTLGIVLCGLLGAILGRFFLRW